MSIVNDTPHFSVLLSTYNGEKFLSDFFESVLAQDYPFFEFYIRDDASTDDTLSILLRYKKRHQSKFHVYAENSCTVGPVDSYKKLLKIALNSRLASPVKTYYLYADQDDIWLPNKMKEYADLIKKEGENVPLLVHSDLKVVDESLNLISESLMSFQGLNPRKNKTFHLGMLNTVVGCTMMINQALAELCSDQGDEAIMHDWWIGLVASLKGKILYLPKRLVHYRQHDSNVCGTVPVQRGNERLLRKLTGDYNKEYYEKVSRQCAAFYKKYNNEMKPIDRVVFNILEKIPRLSIIKAIGCLISLKIVYKLF